MLPLYCSFTAQISFPANRSWRSTSFSTSSGVSRLSSFTFKRTRSELFGKQVEGSVSHSMIQWSFLGGSRVYVQPKIQRFLTYRKHFYPSASWLSGSQIANSAFTLGTIAVLPFYTLMVVAPDAQLTKRSMESSIPYILLGTLYAYLLYLSWTPDTIRLMFASKYWLPELPGITRMFSNEMTLASAWIHLLVVDLFAARQIFFDGLKNGVETRHSVSFCLLFCPLGIIVHSLTKILTKTTNHTK